jgi:hypothetical protein
VVQRPFFPRHLKRADHRHRSVRPTLTHVLTHKHSWVQANRQGRRRSEREIKRLIENNDGCCSLCHAEFPHNSKVYGGIVTYGGAALVGECCESKLAFVVLRTKERTAGSPEK